MDRILKSSLVTWLVLVAPHSALFSQSPKDAQTFALTDTKDLVEQHVKVEEAEYKGRKCVHLSEKPTDNGLALVTGTDFQDGTIEADVALRVTTPPGVRMPGFIGLAFRARADAAHYELFYIRPGNSHSDDQAMRNHSAQYTEAPDFDWYKLRREWPWVYEAHADLESEAWTKLKIEVAGRSAKLFVNGSAMPTLLVDGLKGEDLHGAIALWGSPGQESYFSNLRVTPAPPLSLENNGEANGTWEVKCSTDAGSYTGSLKLTRAGTRINGSWSGTFGDNRPVTGTWRNGYVEFTFTGEWTKDMYFGQPGPAEATLAGWIDGDSASGRMKVQGRADGRWIALRK